MRKFRKISVKHKRGIPIPTRIIFSAFFLLIQLVIFFALFLNLSTKSISIYLISELFGIITVVYIINRRGNPSYKLMWAVFILIFPIFGIFVFLLLGGERVMPHLKKKMKKCQEHFLPFIEKETEVTERLKILDPRHARQSVYLTNEADFPLSDASSVEYLSPGEEFFPKFLSELEMAREYIFIEFFIIAEGIMWDSVYKILCEKVKQGVEVKVMFDDFGSIKRQHKNFISRLQSHGIKVAVFNKIRPSFNIFMNNRNHRKICVIDGKTAVTGGLNLADEYINKFKRFGYWMDCAAIIKGEAVKSFLAMFCTTWEFTTGEQIDIKSHLRDYKVASNGFVQPYSDGPLNNKNPAEGIYMQILDTATDYVYIATPYLIVDNAMITTLKNAANSGIDVRIITPYIPDKWYVHPVTQYNYLELLEAGVKIYEYTPGFIHSKLFVSDDRIATIGTVNMDYRSFEFHFECGVWIDDCDTAMTVKTHFDQLLRASHNITLEEWKKEKPLKRLKRAILNLFSPFM